MNEMKRVPMNEMKLVPTCVECRYHFRESGDIMCRHPKAIAHDIVSGDSPVKARLARRGAGSRGVCGLPGTLFEPPTHLERNGIWYLVWSLGLVAAAVEYWPFWPFGQ